MEVEKMPEVQVQDTPPQPTTPHQGGSYMLTPTGEFVLTERTQETGDKSCQDS